MSLRIVVVDDSEIDRYLTHRVVRALPISVELVQFDAGDRFLDALHANEVVVPGDTVCTLPVLVLLDIHMPRMSGFEVLDSISSSRFKGGQQVVFVLYSSSNSNVDRSEAMNYSVVRDYIVKPLSVDRLTVLLKRLYPV